MDWFLYDRDFRQERVNGAGAYSVRDSKLFMS